MEPLDFTRSKALNNIPKKKLLNIIENIQNGEDTLQNKHIKLLAVNRYSESNIPLAYWGLKMEKDFKGDVNLLKKYEEYVKDIKGSYIGGTSMCLAGSHGVGKSFSICCILKKAAETGYSCLYTTLSDVVSILTQASGEDRFIAKRELSMIDFLALDELDPRFYNQSEASNELFAKAFETIIRTRLQNNLPTLIATNSPNIKNSFLSMFKESLGSLLNKLPIVFVSGTDFRKQDS